jgi:hypothetical protein
MPRARDRYWNQNMATQHLHTKTLYPPVTYYVCFRGLDPVVQRHLMLFLLSNQLSHLLSKTGLVLGLSPQWTSLPRALYRLD